VQTYGTLYHMVTEHYEFFVFYVAKGTHDAHAEKRIEELQERIRELERQNGHMKEKVCHLNSCGLALIGSCVA